MEQGVSHPLSHIPIRPAGRSSWPQSWSLSGFINGEIIVPVGVEVLEPRRRAMRQIVLLDGAICGTPLVQYRLHVHRIPEVRMGPRVHRNLLLLFLGQRNERDQVLIGAGTGDTVRTVTLSGRQQLDRPATIPVDSNGRLAPRRAGKKTVAIPPRLR